MQEKDTLQEKAKEIERQAFEKAEIYGERKWMRVKRTFLVLSAIIYVGAFVLDAMNSLSDFLVWILVAPVMAGMLIAISLAVLSYIVIESTKEEKELARMQGKIDAINLMKWGLL